MTYILSLCFEFGLLMLEFELNGTLLNGVIVTLVPEIVMSSQNSHSMYQNFKVVFDCAFC
jgi:hypothetical protein